MTLFCIQTLATGFIHVVESAPYTILDVAAGVGMLSSGLKLGLELLVARGLVVGGIERDTSATAAFLAWMEHSQGGCPPVWDDARTFVARRDRRLESVDLLCAGYPCQPFSAAGRRLGSKDPRHLWPAVRRIVARVQPQLVFFENVDGHVTMGLWKVLRDCERLGYRVTAGVYSAEEVGAPHLRKRVFILGYRTNTERRSNEPERGSNRRTWEPSGGDGLAHGSGDELGDTDNRECERQSISDRSDGNEMRDADRSRRAIPIFPPHRTDYRRWAELVAIGLDPTLMPAIESGLSVVADGLAASADILRCGGNGVVPLTAAWAFINLAACLFVEESQLGSLGGARRGSD